MEIIASEINFEWITYIALTFPKLISLAPRGPLFWVMGRGKLEAHWAAPDSSD